MSQARAERAAAKAEAEGEREEGEAVNPTVLAGLEKLDRILEALGALDERASKQEADLKSVISTVGQLGSQVKAQQAAVANTRVEVNLAGGGKRGRGRGRAKGRATATARVAKAAQRAWPAGTWPALPTPIRVNLESVPEGEEGDAGEGEEGRPAGPPGVEGSVEGEDEELAPEDAQLAGELSAAFERSDLEAQVAELKAWKAKAKKKSARRKAAGDSDGSDSSDDDGEGGVPERGVPYLPGALQRPERLYRRNEVLGPCEIIRDSELQLCLGIDNWGNLSLGAQRELFTTYAVCARLIDLKTGLEKGASQEEVYATVCGITGFVATRVQGCVRVAEAGGKPAKLALTRALQEALHDSANRVPAIGSEWKRIDKEATKAMWKAAHKAAGALAAAGFKGTGANTPPGQGTETNRQRKSREWQSKKGWRGPGWLAKNRGGQAGGAKK